MHKSGFPLPWRPHFLNGRCKDSDVSYASRWRMQTCETLSASTKRRHFRQKCNASMPQTPHCNAQCTQSTLESFNSILDQCHSARAHLRGHVADKPGEIDVSEHAIVEYEHHVGVGVIRVVLQPVSGPLGGITRIPWPQITLLVHRWLCEHARLCARNPSLLSFAPNHSACPLCASGAAGLFLVQ